MKKKEDDGEKRQKKSRNHACHLCKNKRILNFFLIVFFIDKCITTTINQILKKIRLKTAALAVFFFFPPLRCMHFFRLSVVLRISNHAALFPDHFVLI